MNGASEKRNTEHSIIATWVYKSVLINGNNHGEIAIPTSRRNARIGRTHHSIVITKNMMIVRILGLLGHFLMFRTKQKQAFSRFHLRNGRIPVIMFM